MEIKSQIRNFLKFVRKVTDRIPAKLHGVKTTDPEYWGFACILKMK